MSWESIRQLGRLVVPSMGRVRTPAAVEVEDGVFLGKILYREDRGDYSNFGFFALRVP